jgi:hypothetical protein
VEEGDGATTTQRRREALIQLLQASGLLSEGGVRVGLVSDVFRRIRQQPGCGLRMPVVDDFIWRSGIGQALVLIVEEVCAFHEPGALEDAKVDCGADEDADENPFGAAEAGARRRGVIEPGG